MLPEWGTRQAAAAEAAATRHHHHQHSRHNSQRAGPVATCNISSKAAAARLPLPSFLPPLSSSSPFPSQSLYCRSSAAVVVYFSLELSLECCQRKCAYVAAAAAVPSCSSSGSASSPCSSSTCGMPQTPANQKLLLFSATIPAPLHSPQLLPPLAAAASCCCHIMEMSSCSPLRFHKRVDLQPFNTSDDPEHATTETTTNIPLSYLQQAVAPSTTSVALNVQCATCGTAAASAQLS